MATSLYNVWHCTIIIDDYIIIVLANNLGTKNYPTEHLAPLVTM